MDRSLLLVDDDYTVCQSLSKLLKAHGYAVHSTTDPSEALRLVREKDPDLVVTDLKMPSVDGIDLIRAIRVRRIEVPIIVISGFASVENIVAAMQYGATNFFEKPVKSSKLIEEIERILSAGLLPEKAQGSDDDVIITQNPIMRSRLEMVETAAPTDAPIIITGESGTGKELFAAAIHKKSMKRDNPMVSVNCAAIPETLMESELFGYAKGAFTDAKDSKPGKFEIAENSTLFFDEIGELGLNTQAKILRAIQEREYEPVGSNDVKKMNVRFVAATNRNLEQMVEQGVFREDLYYRFAVIRIDIPPLRERKDDIIILSNSFIQHFNNVYKKNIIGLSDEVQSIFITHNWPGNVRELKNSIERAVIFSTSSLIGVSSLPDHYHNLKKTNGNVMQALQESIAKEIIIETLNTTGGNRQKTAEILGMSRRTLYNKMKKLGI